MSPAGPGTEPGPRRDERRQGRSAPPAEAPDRVRGLAICGWRGRMGCSRLPVTEGPIVKLTCDMDANVAYLRLRKRQGDEETIALTSDFLVDIDETGAVCGVEMLNATEHLAGGDEGRLIVEMARKGVVGEMKVA